MDDKIFVKEPQQGSNKTQLILMGIAAVLVVVGLLGVIAVLFNNEGSKGNTTPPAAESTPPAVEPTTPPVTEPTPPTTPPAPTPTPTTPPTSGEVTYAPPTDATKVHVYFPKSPETTNNPKQMVAA